MFDRFEFRRRAALRDIASDFDLSRGAVHIEELAVDHHDPFHGEPRHEHRWLLTTCLAGLASSIVVGGALVGLFGYVFPRDVSEVPFKSIFWQQSSATAKGDFVGTVTRVGRSSIEPSSSRITAVYNTSEPVPVARTVLTARSFSGASYSAAYPSITDDVLPYGSHTRPPKFTNHIRTASLSPDNMTTILKAAQPDPEDKIVVLEAGDSLVDLLTGIGSTPDAAQAMTAAVELIFPLKQIREGQEFSVTVEYRPDFYGQYVPYPARLVFSPSPGEQVVVEADSRGRYFARIDGEGDADGGSLLANLPYNLVKAKITSTLYTSAKEQGVPEHIIAEVMRVHSYDVDFERELKPGDEMEVFYGRPLDGSNPKRKVLLYSALTLQGKPTGYYRFTTPDDGITDYYDSSGQSVRKALLRTPISGARTSSGFGMRRHPILGYTKMHAGIDFAAPTGTPIKAAGDGVVEMASRFGAYGNYVRLRHSDPYKTAYAHMSRIARGIQPGTRVRQGQVIGYVGTTGRSTGPHLHYEILVNNRQVNPMKVRIDNGRKLSGEMLALFQQQMEKIKAMMRAAPTSTQVAEVEHKRN
ncbi:peptidoglycan DD-metalloendopeptidase family protein [Rhodoligotrophos defluvii]|uniref:peptidoglycan DD-metalloendopeptidase family protein n=1 Tax=Rhodoligotrophos defluvii TaxID=2561934 RepID=UPI0010C9FDA4|nr:peptidoglycan DD-metalloendopeptidase family protein [Rhodoligotrophos defluvii]